MMQGVQNNLAARIPTRQRCWLRSTPPGISRTSRWPPRCSWPPDGTAHPAGRRARCRQDRGRQGACRGAGHPAAPAAVLRGPDLRRGPVRVELPAPVAGHQAGRGPRRGAAGRGPVQRRIPAGPPAARRARPPRAAPGGAADRRGRPGGRRVRGVPVRVARRVRGHDPGTRHPPGPGSARSWC